MKHLKRYNEELDPDTYKKAGQRLSNMGHTERGANLLTYGHEKANDIFNFWLGEIDSSTNFINPIEASYSGLKVKFPNNEFRTYSNRYQGEYWEKIMYDLVNEYKLGQSYLYLDLQTNFTISPRQRLQLKDISHKIQNGKINSDITGLNDKYLIHALSSDYNSFPFLTFRLNIADSLYWEDEEGYCKLPTEEEFHESFDDVFYPNIHLVQSAPIPVEMGYSNRSSNTVDRKIISILSNRRDANKFKNTIIPKIVNDIKPLIQDLFSEHLQTTPEQFERSVSAISNININKIYKDKVNMGGGSEAFKKQFLPI